MGNPKQEFVYGACMRNHAAKLGGHATDGCGEFTPVYGGFQCGACECHQNFHQKITVVGTGGGGGGGGGGGDLKGESSSHTGKVETEMVEVSEDNDQEKKLMQRLEQQQHEVVVQMRRGRRPRTKFTVEQRQRMFAFATRLGWKILKNRWDEINRFCQSTRVSRHVFKVWLNNHKIR